MNVLKMQVFHGNEMHGWHTFDPRKEQCVKIGSLKVSHIQLDGLARMHAVAEAKGNRWHLIDLGSHEGTYVRGEKIRNAPLRNGDEIQFGLDGPWRIRVAIESAVEVEKETAASHEAKKHLTETDVRAGSGQRTVPYHHQRTFDGLIGELTKLDTSEDMKRLVSQFSIAFDKHDDAAKANRIRTLVDLLRSTRQTHRFQVDVSIGVVEAAIRTLREGEKLYDLPEDEAADRALDIILSLKDVREGMKFLGSLPESMRSVEGSEHLLAGIKHVEQKLARRASSLFVEMIECLRRAGGMTKEEWKAHQKDSQKKILDAVSNLSDEDRAKLPAEFEQWLSHMDLDFSK